MDFTSEQAIALARYGWQQMIVYFREPYDLRSERVTQSSGIGRLRDGWLVWITGADKDAKNLEVVYIPAPLISAITGWEEAVRQQ